MAISSWGDKLILIRPHRWTSTFPAPAKPSRTSYPPCLSPSTYSSSIKTKKDANEGNDLHLTFTFEWPHPELEEGSEQAKELAASRTAMGRGVVPHTIEVAREMKASGRLG